MGVPEYLSKRVRIRATNCPSRKCELMKLSLPFVSSMYADAAFTVAAQKYWNSLPDDLLYHILLPLNVDYIQICYHYMSYFKIYYYSCIYLFICFIIST